MAELHCGDLGCYCSNCYNCKCEKCKPYICERLLQLDKIELIRCKICVNCLKFIQDNSPT